MSELYDALIAAGDNTVRELESPPRMSEPEPDDFASTKERAFPGFDRMANYAGPLPRKMTVSHRKIRAYLLLAMLAVGLTVIGTQYASHPNEGVFTKGPGVNGVAFEGTIHPAVEIRITAAVSGTVSAILVKAGDTVQQGQALLSMDDREARLNLTEAGVALRAAEANLATFRSRLAEANARVAIAQNESQLVPTRQWRDSPERAQAAYDHARTNYDRAKQLFDSGVISKQELDDRATEMRIAHDDLENAEHLASVSVGLEHDQAEQASLQAKVTREELQNQLRQAQLKYQGVQRAVDETIVRATQTGVVSEVSARLGDRIPGGTVLVRLAELDHMIVEVPVSGKMLSELKVGGPAIVELPSSPVRQVEGQIRVISPLPSENMTHNVEVEFQNPALLLLAGQPAEVRFVKL